MNKKLGLFSVLALTSSLSLAQGVPNTFSAGQPARAAEVNENFASLVTDITSNEAAITDVDARITNLEGSVDPTTTTVNVDCASDSINNTINNAPAYGKLIVNISGNCTETVLITRDNVSLIGAVGASIAYDTAITNSPYRSSLVSVINVIGADNVIISNLNLNGANDNARAAGLRILNSASVLISDVTAENNATGIWVSNSSSLQMSESTVQSNSSYEVLVTDNASAQIRENNTLAHTSTSGATLGVYRNGSVRIRQGGNTISTNTNETAIEANHGSQVRSDNGNLTVNGNVISTFFGQIDLRDTIINGNFNAGIKGIVRLNTRNIVTVNGDVNVATLGFFEATGTSSNTTVTGDVICNGYNSATLINDTAIVTGSVDLNSSCNQ